LFFVMVVVVTESLLFVRIVLFWYANRECTIRWYNTDLLLVPEGVSITSVKYQEPGNEEIAQLAVSNGWMEEEWLVYCFKIYIFFK